jgi:3-hydroxy-9,10-secoandrosta-1,3,5(10)-triene-9,17-dione monooxygenase reductase component
MRESHSLRDVLGRFVTGVTVVTASGPGGPVGITANSFTSVSLDPALVLFCVHRDSRVRAILKTSRSFAVNILTRHQESLSRQFSRSSDRRGEDTDFRFSETGTPLLADALAYLDCEVYRHLDAGDHVIVIGRVREYEIQSAAEGPLAFYGGRYTNLEPAGTRAPSPGDSGDSGDAGGEEPGYSTLGADVDDDYTEHDYTDRDDTAHDHTDYDLIRPITVPHDHRIPGEVTGVATSREYEDYFRVLRESIDLSEWTRTCLAVNQALVADLGDTDLGEDDKYDILAGLVTVHEVTLSHWLAASSHREGITS